MSAPKSWWICVCGRKLYEHGVRTVPNTGGKEYVCAQSGTGRFKSETSPDFVYDNQAGLSRAA